ncbi:MAG: hypothetical protein DYG89_45220 [Caldilinea sp. CFX5]|nr:hypothetical protein [Caldilinea sp. CFX5]
MKAMRGTWKTISDTFTVVGRYRPYGIYPLLAFVVLLLVMGIVVLPLVERVLAPQGLLGWIGFALAAYLAYGVLYGITAVGNVMLVLGIAGRLDGVELASTQELLVRTVQRLPLIALYAVVAAGLGVVSLLLRVLISPLFGGLIAPRIGDRLWVRWQQLSYKIPLQLAVPVIALDQPAPVSLFGRGAALVKTTWGERVKPAHGMGLLTLVAVLLIMLYAIPTLQQGLVEDNTALQRLGLAVTLLVIGLYTQLSGLVNAIFALAAYRYATVRKADLVPGDASYAEAAFVPAKKATEPDAAATTAHADVPPMIANDASH